MKNKLWKKGLVLGIIVLFIGIAIIPNIHAEVSKTNFVQKKTDNIPPVADAGGPYNGKAGEVIVLDGSDSYDPDGIIVEWYWYYIMKFGPLCTLPITIGFGETIEYSWDYSKVFSIYVYLRVKDNDGAIDYDETNVIIENLVSSQQSSTGSTVVKKATMPTSYDGNTLYVGGTGPGNYSSIQSAINAANPGDTVFVYNGTYYENVVVDKSIDLIGENRDTTIIDGSKSGSVVYISADLVNISGFKIRNCGLGYFGVFVGYSSKHIISGNSIMDNHDPGIFIRDSTDNIISKNTITNNKNVGIFQWNSNFTKIMDNNISDNDCFGIQIEVSYNNTIINNTIINNGCDGIMLKTTFNSIISNNIITNNFIGINIERSDENKILENNIIDNEFNAMRVWSSYKNLIYHNNFINNSRNAHDTGQNRWDNRYPSGGNYWDDYIGNDQYCGGNQDIPGSDGIGDTPYRNITGEDNEDRYPFMRPNGWEENYPPIVDLFIGPSYGKPGIRYSFMAGFYDPDWDCFYIKFDWGDGSFSDWLGSYGNGNWVDVPHAWSKGGYNIRVKAKDLHGAESNWSEPIKLRIESDPPTVEIIKPDKALYILNKKIIPRFLRQSLIIGNIDVTVDANDFTGIDKVEFYIDNKLKSVDNSSPYSYTWTRDRLQFIHLHVLKVIAYDYCGNMASDKIIVRRFL